MSKEEHHQRTTHPAVALFAAAVLVTGCASPPPAPTAAAPAPSLAQARELSPAEARDTARRLTIEAVEQLQNGDEAAARVRLDRALELDPGNELARKLVAQISADAQKELGPVFFRYAVQRDESLSMIAQRYLGDRFRFYILAKYNGIANPGRLAVGQVIKIPGTAPAAPGARTQRETKPAARDWPPDEENDD